MSKASKHESITQKGWLGFDPEVVASHVSKFAHFMTFHDEYKINHPLTHTVGLINTLSTLGVHETS